MSETVREKLRDLELVLSSLDALVMGIGEETMEEILRSILEKYYDIPKYEDLQAGACFPVLTLLSTVLNIIKDTNAYVEDYFREGIFKPIPASTKVLYHISEPFTMYLTSVPMNYFGELKYRPILFVPINVEELGEKLTPKENPTLTIMPLDTSFMLADEEIGKRVIHETFKNLRKSILDKLMDRYIEKYGEYFNLLRNLNYSSIYPWRNPLIVFVPYQNISSSSLSTVVENLDRLFSNFSLWARADEFPPLLAEIGSRLMNLLQSGEVEEVYPSYEECYVKFRGWSEPLSLSQLFSDYTAYASREALRILEGIESPLVETFLPYIKLLNIYATPLGEHTKELGGRTIFIGAPHIDQKMLKLIEEMLRKLPSSTKLLIIDVTPLKTSGILRPERGVKDIYIEQGLLLIPIRERPVTSTTPRFVEVLNIRRKYPSSARGFRKITSFPLDIYRLPRRVLGELARYVSPSDVERIIKVAKRYGTDVG